MSDQNNLTVSNNDTAASSTSALEMAEGDEVIMSLIQILARVMSILSVIGSCYILFNLVGNKSKKVKSMKSSFNRLLVALCISDVVGSVAIAFGNLAVPASPRCDFQGDDSQEIWDVYFPGASGNGDTCTVQGFFVQLGTLGSALFTCFITLQTVLVVVFRFREAFMKRVETAFFVLGILAPLVTSIYGAAAGLMFPVMSGYCWIGNTVFPIYIMKNYPPNEENCEAELLGYDLSFQTKVVRTGVLVFGWIFAILLIIIISMIILFRFVRMQERQASRWSQNARQGQRQKQVFARALPYIVMYPLIWIPSLRSAFGLNRPNIEFHLLASLLLPLQGFLNSLVYAGLVDKCLRKCCCCCCTWCLAATPTRGNRNTFVSGTSRFAGNTRSFVDSNESMSLAPEHQSSVLKTIPNDNDNDNLETDAELCEEAHNEQQGSPNTTATRPPNNNGVIIPPSNARNITGANTPHSATSNSKQHQSDD